MANAGEKYLINDIVTKASLIVDLVNENERMNQMMDKMEAVLTPAQKKKLEST